MNNQRMCAIAIAIFFIALYSLFSIGHYGGDGYEDYLTAKSIVLNHSLSFSDSPTKNIDEFNYLNKTGIPGRDGKLYSSRGGLVVPLILSMFYLKGHIFSTFFKNIPHDFVTMFFVSFANPVICAINCLLVFLISSNLSFSRRISVALAFIYGLTTMMPVYTRTGFEEPSMVLFMLLAFHFAVKYKKTLKNGYLLLSGTAIGLSVFTKSTAIIFLPAYIIYAGILMLGNRLSGRHLFKDAAVFSLALTVILMLVAWYNYFIYGKILKFGGREALAVSARVAEAPHILKGLYYYLVSAGKGFFIFNIPVLLSFIGIASAFLKRKQEAVFILLIFMLNLIFFAMSFRRGSLFAWGPRYLFPSVAFLIFLAGDFFENHRSMSARIASWGASIIGFFVMLPCMFVNQSKFYFFVKDKLGLPEYMINFIPDLSPILGAWKMFASRILYTVKGMDPIFMYNPDYRLISPISASMAGYNNFDSWVIKIINFSPEYSAFAVALAAVMAIISAATLTYILYECSRSDTEL